MVEVDYCLVKFQGDCVVKRFTWRTDPDAEKIIRDFAFVDFEIVEINFADIDWVESANNGARLTEPFNSEKIDEYAAAFRHGDIFPMPVMEKNENGYIILGGNQRCNALKQLEIKELVISCYVVDPLTTANRELILRSLNARHGLGATKQEKLEHAVYLVGKGIDIEVAARALTVTSTSIRTRLRATECKKELIAAKITNASDPKIFSNSHLDQLSRVADRDRRMQIAKVVDEFHPSADSIGELVRGVCDSDSSASAHKLIATFAKEIRNNKSQTKNSKRSNNKYRDLWFRKIAALESFLETGNKGGAFSAFDELGLSHADADKALTSIAKIESRFNCLKQIERNRK